MLFRLNRWLILLMLGILITATPVWSKQFPSPPGRFKPRRLGRMEKATSLGSDHTTQNLKIISGRIEGIKIATTTAGTSSNIVEITLKGKSDRLCYVALAPYWYIYSQQFNLAKGDKIQAYGFLKLEGKDYRMLATEIIHEKSILKLRDARGIPLWGASPREKTYILGQVLSNRLQTPKTKEETTLSPREQRPDDYGPQYPEKAAGKEKEKKKEGLTLLLAQILDKLDTGLKLIGVGGRIAILFVLVIIMVFSISHTCRAKNSWRDLKAKHHDFK